MSIVRGALVCLYLTVTAYQGRAEHCGAGASAAIATDRPQVTSSSIVVPCGSLQFENGVERVQHGFDLPETSIRFGVPGKAELRLGVPNYLYYDNAPSGFGDMSIGFKTQLGPALGGFDVSVVPTLSLPSGASQISSHGYDPSVQVPWSHAIGKNWTAAGMFSVLWPTQDGRRNVTGQASFYLDRQLTAPLDAYVEYSGDFPERGGPQHSIDFGFAYKLSPHQQLDFHTGFGLSAAATDYTVGVGYSVRFQLVTAR
jgi:Putative MetA-pathway of phenol degradation